ncbi:ArsR/SmtB family transcription factor [Cerasicoccus maritimus]|uniref:ArsR/SmtB family transcription factor n=1 Tax=Cerasicoccus maritimus TaxID=490089 RepID=UPI002852496E|nr:metalloregulator ArsR/SmtB family transcription factor [Cerasicoccus maritimus]
MAFSKSNIFTREQIALADFAKCLAHPARIAIITLLKEHGDRTCGELVEALPLAQPTVSQHLKALREGGLLLAENHGNSIRYSINCENIKHFCHSFQCTLGTVADGAGI